jgi:replication-associated recombination protein RarA
VRRLYVVRRCWRCASEDGHLSDAEALVYAAQHISLAAGSP